MSKIDACLKEKYYIQYFNSYNNGYNASLGGESGSNGCNKETKNREKISKGIKEYLKSHPEAIQKRKETLLDKEN